MCGRVESYPKDIEHLLVVRKDWACQPLIEHGTRKEVI